MDLPRHTRFVLRTPQSTGTSTAPVENSPGTCGPPVAFRRRSKAELPSISRLPPAASPLLREEKSRFALQLSEASWRAFAGTQREQGSNCALVWEFGKNPRERLSNGGDSRPRERCVFDEAGIDGVCGQLERHILQSAPQTRKSRCSCLRGDERFRSQADRTFPLERPSHLPPNKTASDVNFSGNCKLLPELHFPRAAIGGTLECSGAEVTLTSTSKPEDKAIDVADRNDLRKCPSEKERQRRVQNICLNGRGAFQRLARSGGSRLRGWLLQEPGQGQRQAGAFFLHGED